MLRVFEFKILMNALAKRKHAEIKARVETALRILEIDLQFHAKLAGAKVNPQLVKKEEEKATLDENQQNAAEKAMQNMIDERVKNGR